ncbi:MAG: hypothetical protein GY811_26155 [Myxococcales bacterium]|nr:hypothetical protein [Myxococcales bacterium]
MDELMTQASSGIGVTLALSFFVGAYFFAVWDARREGAAEDGQVGLKLVLYTLILGTLGVAVGGVDTLLHFMLSGAETGTPAIKAGVAGIAAGGLILAGLVMVMLPRTNTKDNPKAFRMTLGFVAVIAGSAAIVYFSLFVTSMIMGGGTWVLKSRMLAHFITYGAVGYFALNTLGGLSGWTAPTRPQAIPQGGGYPPQQSGGIPQGGGYPPQQGGMPQQGGYPPQGGMPQQGGYPPQSGGGYPPQSGGGYPPQGGGHPPQGGGHPPQGGGGHPPQGGGGHPPQGGGYPPQGGGGYPPR